MLFIGSGTAVVDGIAAIRAAGRARRSSTNSNNASGGFVKALKENARGVIVTQVFPKRTLAGRADREGGQ